MKCSLHLKYITLYRRIISHVSDRIRSRQVSSLIISNSYITKKCKLNSNIKNLKSFCVGKRKLRRKAHAKLFYSQDRKIRYTTFHIKSHRSVKIALEVDNGFSSS